MDQMGRIVVPKALRDALGLVAGSAMDISRYGAGLQLVPDGRTARLVEEGGVLVASGREAALSGHALAETYSALTRLPGDSRLAPGDAARLLRERFSRPLLINPDTAEHVADTLSQLGIVGGAVYDALVALAARDNGVQLATRDARAKATYDAVGIDVVVVG